MELTKKYEEAINYMVRPPRHPYEVDLPVNLLNFVSFYPKFFNLNSQRTAEKGLTEPTTDFHPRTIL